MCLLDLLTLNVFSTYSPASTAPISKTPFSMAVRLTNGLTPLPTRVRCREAVSVLMLSTSWKTRPAVGVKDTSMVWVASGGSIRKELRTTNGPVVSKADEDS